MRVNFFLIYCYSISIIAAIFDEKDKAIHHKIIYTSSAYLRHCKQIEYLKGSWVSINQKTHRKNNPVTEYGQKSFLCCDLSDYRNYSAICEQQPPIKLISYFGNSSQIPIAYSNACSCDIRENTRFIKSEREKWVWKPNNCNMHHFDAQDFCHMLRNRTIQWIGDSLTQQTAITLMSMISANGGPCANQIAFGRSNFLYFQQKSDESQLEVLVKAVKPDIVIMNSGAHLEDDGDIRTVIHLTNITVNKLRADFVSANLTAPSFYWSTQLGGHYYCMFHKKPLSEFSANFSGLNDTYRWNKFPGFDKIAYEMLVQNTGKLARLHTPFATNVM